MVLNQVIKINRCIYINKDDTTCTFNSEEHIFPKCIGGKCCLPKGFVSDQINNEFSKSEYQFARENPIVVINRMFYEKTGRKKHKNRDKIAVLVDNEDVSLGYISFATPKNISQLIFENLDRDINGNFQVKFLLDANLNGNNQERINHFIESLKKYKGSPKCIKSNKISSDKYILGMQDNKWFIGVNKDTNPENVKKLLDSAVKKIISYFENNKAESEMINCDFRQITANYEFMCNLNDIYRIYAKISFNALASLKGQEFVLSSNFDKIRECIAYGYENISTYIGTMQDVNIIKDITKNFDKRIKLGDKYHYVVFFTINKTLYSFISLYGSNQPLVIELGKIENHIVDMYICDWQNQKEYKLIDYVVEICQFNRETIIDTSLF